MTKEEKREYDRKRYQLKKEELLAKTRAYKAAHREKYKLKRKEYYEKNKERTIEYNKVWVAQNRDKRLATERKYVECNRHKVYAKNARREASKLKATPPWADLDDIAKIYKQAQILTEETGVVHSVDHIVPLRSDKVCGLHCSANLTVLTKSENCSKGNRHWPDMT